MAIDMPKSRNRLPLPELLFVPSTVAELQALRNALTAAGYTRPKVAGCVDFVLGRAQGNDETSGTARAEYRRMLSELLQGPFGGDGRTPIRYVPAAA